MQCHDCLTKETDNQKTVNNKSRVDVILQYKVDSFSITHPKVFYPASTTAICQQSTILYVWNKDNL